jgi:hypothetical protein
MRDRVDEGGNQQFGFFRPDYTPRKAAVYLHNLTTILADNGTLAKPGKLNYGIPNKPATVHDLLLQKSDGTFALVVWGELIKGEIGVGVDLGDDYGGVRLFDPTVGILPIEIHGTVHSLTLPMGDHPLVIAIPARANRSEP